MKKIIFAILFLIPSICFAQRAGIMIGVGTCQYGGGAECSTVYDSDTETAVTSNSFGQYSTRVYWAHKVTATKDFTLCGVGFELKSVGSPTQTITYYIFPNTCSTCDGTDDEPDDVSEAVWSSTSFSASTVSSDGAMLTKTGSSTYSVTDEDVFWIGGGAPGLDASNYILLRQSAFYGGEGAFAGGDELFDVLTNDPIKFEVLEE